MITARAIPRCASIFLPSLRCVPPTTGRFARSTPWRRFSSNSAPGAGAQAPGPAASSAGMLAPFTNELDRIAPCFQINGSQIQVIQTPAEFYQTLKDKILNAERRIFLSTLYIGKSETKLVSTLQEALRAKPSLKLSILTDALRGTREAPEPSSASLLAPLVAEFGSDRVEIRMYHTPNLTGLRKTCLPKRINEGFGLQHMKLYGFDDEVILSGANLSSDYFTNRQDRYHLFSSKTITDYFSELQHGVCSFSFLIEPSTTAPSGFEMTWPQSNRGPSPLDNPKEFVAKSTSTLRRLIAPRADSVIGQAGKDAASRGGRSAGTGGTSDTSVYVLAQMSQLLRPDSSTELPAVTHVLSTLALPAMAGSSWTFTAGYFNPAPSLTKLLLSTSSSHGTVITASPQANGFYRSRGVSGMLPDAYTLLARRFLDAANKAYKNRRGLRSSATAADRGSTLPPPPTEVELKEWRRGTSGEPGGWTYHAKGLWVTLPGETNPSVTVVGSSNYTKRSYSLDLEAGALVVTSNETLRRRLADEQRWLQEHAAPITMYDFERSERRVRLQVRVAMFIVKLMGGAL